MNKPAHHLHFTSTLCHQAVSPAFFRKPKGLFFLESRTAFSNLLPSFFQPTARLLPESREAFSLYAAAHHP
jgi:hypothetical protein